mgnify:CR=1 FL=1
MGEPQEGLQYLTHTVHAQIVSMLSPTARQRESFQGMQQVEPARRSLLLQLNSLDSVLLEVSPQSIRTSSHT